MVALTQSSVLQGSSLLQQRALASRPCRAVAVPARAFFGFDRKKEEIEADKEDQYRKQQEVLARRRTNSWQSEVKERRAKTTKFMRDPKFRQECIEENRRKFKERQAEEPEVPKFGIIIPLIPIGLPEYDGGERFDLRLPYVDNGWVDEEADFGKQVARFFGMGKKKDEGNSNNKKDDGKKGKNPKRK